MPEIRGGIIRPRSIITRSIRDKMVAARSAESSEQEALPKQRTMKGIGLLTTDPGKSVAQDSGAANVKAGDDWFNNGLDIWGEDFTRLRSASLTSPKIDGSKQN